MTAGRRKATVAAIVALIMVAATAAAFAWTKAGVGAGAAKAKSLTEPLTVSAAPTTGSTATSITISVTGGPAAASATPSGYRVDRVSPAATAVCTISGTTGTCNDTGRTASTTYSYKIFSLIGSNLAAPAWVSAGNATAGATTAAAGLTITSIQRDGGNKKIDFLGTGATSGATVTVSICKVNTFPCPTAGPDQRAGTATATGNANGTWTTGSSSANLADGVDYYAQAVQASPSRTSSVFGAFQVTGL